MKLREDRVEKYQQLKKNLTQNNTNAETIFQYAETWAELMEKELLEGPFDAFTVYTTSQMADNGRVSSYQHDCAKHILILYWVYGVRLKSQLIRPFYEEDKVRG